MSCLSGKLLQDGGVKDALFDHPVGAQECQQAWFRLPILLRA